MNLIISLGCRTEYSDPIGLCVKTMRLLDRKTERTENAADGGALLTSLLKGPTSSVLCSSAFSATRGSVEMHVPNRRRAVQIPMSMAIFFALCSTRSHERRNFWFTGTANSSSRVAKNANRPVAVGSPGPAKH
jgi:hypothetical protein